MTRSSIYTTLIFLTLQSKGSSITLQAHRSFVVHVLPYWNRKKKEPKTATPFAVAFTALKCS